MTFTTNRFYFTLSLCYLIALAGCHHIGSNRVEGTKHLPNILIITADDLAYNSIGAYGCKVPDITPNIDKFAEQSVRFMHAHVNTVPAHPIAGLLAGAPENLSQAESTKYIGENNMVNGK